MSEPTSSGTPIVLPHDNCVIVFRTQRSAVYGRLVRLGSVTQSILSAHGLPPVAAQLLGETVALAALVGSALHETGNIAVQTKTDGIVSVLYADCEAPGRLRGYARCDTGTLQALTASGDKIDAVRGLGVGHLAFTFDTGADAERYQGVIALDGAKLADGAAQYFEQREALPTYVRVAAAQHFSKCGNGLAAERQWRAGGIMIQYPGSRGDEPDDVSEDDAWQRVRMLTATIEDHELLDPTLTSERLLLRLFHEEGVRIERVVPLSAYCKCSRAKVANVLASFSADDMKDMLDEAGKISVTCEFCAQTYQFAPGEFNARQGED